MNGKNTEQLSGTCEHGNFLSTCEVCNPTDKSYDTKLINNEGKNRSLSYKPELKSLLEERPGITKQVLKLVKSLESKPEGTTAEADGLTVTYFQERNWSKNFKIESDGETFFLRKEMGRGTGHKAMASFEEAE